ncbi:MAG: hypothetical protein ACOY33_05345 [Pseudomonadota bacterium]
MKSFPLLLIAFLVTPSHAADLVGSVVPPYPAGLDSRQGRCVPGGEGYEHVCDYGIGILEDAGGKKLMLLGQKSVPGPENPQRWLITDAVAYPAMAEDQYLAIGVCEIDGAPDEAVIAVAGVVDAEFSDRIVQARRLDRATGKFIELPPAGIRCLNEDRDAD